VGGGITIKDNVRINIGYTGPQVADLNNITATKSLDCSGNISAGGAPVTGGNITAQSKTGQCSGL
jgi:hypothetical protein